MNTPHDLRHFNARDYDQFQMIPPHSAGWALLTLVALVCILEPVLS